MFLEQPLIPGNGRGWVEVISGSMFSGKTEELIRRLNRARLGKQRVCTFKPEVDARYDQRSVVSHDARVLDSISVEGAEDILQHANKVEVVGIDEAQFFDAELPAVVNRLANKGLRVIVAGLDMDYRGRPFGTMPELLTMAEYVTKVHAICVVCGRLAHYSYRKGQDRELFKLGEKESYEALCRDCYFERMK